MSNLNKSKNSRRREIFAHQMAPEPVSNPHLGQISTSTTVNPPNTPSRLLAPKSRKNYFATDIGPTIVTATNGQVESATTLIANSAKKRRLSSPRNATKKYGSNDLKGMEVGGSSTTSMVTSSNVRTYRSAAATTTRPPLTKPASSTVLLRGSSVVAKNAHPTKTSTQALDAGKRAGWDMKVIRISNTSWLTLFRDA